VIIPTYNRAGLIREAIQSVVDQTYTDWELIVVDDGSTDETAQVVAEFGEQVHYIRQDNAGACTARNAGFLASRGDYITFLDSDDCMLPHNLEILANTLESHQDVGVAYGWGYFYRQEFSRRELMDYQRIQGEIPPQIDPPWEGAARHPGGTTLEGQILPQLVLEDSMLLGGNLVRRSCIEAIGGFDTRIKYMEHWDFFLRLAMAGFTFTCCRQAVMLYRNHLGNRFRDSAPMLQDHLTILNRIFTDPSWQFRLKTVKGRAYYFAYFNNVLANFSFGNPDQGVKNLNTALSYASLTDHDLTLLAGCIAKRAIDSYATAPLNFVDEIFMNVQPTSQVHLLRGKVLALVHMAVAFQEHRSSRLQMASHHALAAIRHDLSLLHNRGLLRVFIEGIGGHGVLDWVRSHRQQIVSDLASRIADRPCIFISPHFDDVVLSCGGTLVQLSRQRTKLLLVTVFTADQTDSVPLSPLARQMHDKWGSALKPFEVRKREDKATADYLKAEYCWLEFPEVIYRYPALWEDEILYPSFNPRSDASYEPVSAALLGLLNEHPYAVVFAPLGLGYHRDHILVHEAVKDAARAARTSCSLLFYEDFPYAASADLKQRMNEITLKLKPMTINISSTLSERIRLTNMHASQMTMLFGDLANAEVEIQAYANRVGTSGKPRERFWYSNQGLKQHGR
jgi:glycosyltransferase involved in cell wall biosynthesis/LmbE family N-acetylglucosaminyl deacetylase